MGFSAYLIHYSAADRSKIKHALRIYWIQLAVNFSWSIVFFRFKALWAGFAVILLLFVLIAAMISRFFKLRPSAAYINIPYLLWAGFAGYLNLATIIVNR